jgi:hypothetical protein
MIREYLGRVSVAATEMLPKGDRLLFVGRTRAALEAKIGPLASADADDVLSALNALGDPEALAKRERERLYSARRRGAAAAPPTLWKPSKESRRGAAPPLPPAGRRPGLGQARKPRPWPHRGLAGPDEMKPVESAAPPPAEPTPRALPAAVPHQADSPEATPPPRQAPAVGSPAAEGPPVAVPPVAVPPAAVLPVGGPETPPEEPVMEELVPDEPETAALDGAGPEPGGSPPGWMRPVRPAPAPEEAQPVSIVPGMGQPGEAEEPPAARRRSPVAEPLAEAWALARKHPLEAVSVVLLGLGGLILPFPFWLIGGLVALRSRRWDARDKWMALAGPPLFTFAVLLIRAGTSQGSFFSAFYQASRHDVGLSIRAGCVLCAGYLIWRLRRGPRLRTLPPWQRPR